MTDCDMIHSLISSQILEFLPQHSKYKQKPTCQPFHDHQDHNGRIFAVDEGSHINEELDSDQTKIMETRAVAESCSIIRELDSGKTIIMETGEFGEGSSIKEELDNGKTKIMETGGPDSSENEDIPGVMASFKRNKKRRSDSDMDTSKHEMSDTFGEVLTDIPPKKYEQITSETLKELFNSFKVDFPADVPGCESFAREILEDDINRLVTAIQSLSHRIVLSSQINAIKPDTPQVEACVFEVEVVYDDGGDGEEETQFCVFRKKGHTGVSAFLF